MAQPIVLVVFYSRSGSTEKLALAAAVGAVQARAAIRLRRLADVSELHEANETLSRLRKEYVSPREIDILGADGLILAAPVGFSTSSAEWVDFLELLQKLASEGKLKDKAAAAIDGGDETTLVAFNEAIIRLGITPVPPDSVRLDVLANATALGRRLAATLHEPRRV
jgi:NAD(P)H dehydrogenase (quinone)